MPRPTAFLIQPLHREFEPVHRAVSAAAQRVGLAVTRADPLYATDSITEQIYDELESADLVIADISRADSNVMYELGFVHGVQRPVLLIASDVSAVPFDVASVRVLVYGRDTRDLARFEHDLGVALEAAIRDASSLARRPTTRRDANRLFISYSHRDRPVLERLLVHLKPLEREGLIDAWNDTRIEAGADWKREVGHALERARAAILLVTADFLGSEFIVDNELPPLLRSAESRGTVIIPLIVKPCRYTRDQRLRRLQAINDPARPLAGLDDVEQERLLDSVAATVERAMGPVK